MAGRHSPDRTVRKILICIFMVALFINGAFWIKDTKIHNAEEALPELKTAVYSAEKADRGSDDAFVRNMALRKWPTEQSSKHNIVLEDRKNMTLTGIVEISSFDERKIVLMTEQEQLTVTGNLLHICKFNTQTGEVRVEGRIDSLVYSDKENVKVRLRDKLRERLNLGNRAL